MKLHELFEAIKDFDYDEEYIHANKPSALDWFYDQFMVSSAETELLNYYSKYRKDGNFPEGFIFKYKYDNTYGPDHDNAKSAFWMKHRETLKDLDGLEDIIGWYDDDRFVIDGDFFADGDNELNGVKLFPPKDTEIAEIKGFFYYSDFDGFQSWIPKKVKTAKFNNVKNVESLKGFNKVIEECTLINFDKTLQIKSNMLSLFKIKGLTRLVFAYNKEIEDIFCKHLPSNDMLGCQQDLIDAGYEDYAKL